MLSMPSAVPSREPSKGEEMTQKIRLALDPKQQKELDAAKKKKKSPFPTGGHWGPDDSWVDTYD